MSILNGYDRAWVGIEKLDKQWTLYNGERLGEFASLWALPHHKNQLQAKYAYLTERGVEDTIDLAARLPVICEHGKANKTYADSNLDFSKVLHDIWLPGICLEYSSRVLLCRTQANFFSLQTYAVWKMVANLCVKNRV